MEKTSAKRNLELIGNYLTYFAQIDKTTFVFSLLFLVGATSLFKKGFPKIAKTVVGFGSYLFVRGILTTGMLFEWWTQIPEIVQAIFFIPQ